ncbi:MAG: ArsA family ATPase [Thermoplasmata archaeon]
MIISFMGKGGTGKTSISVAYSLYLKEQGKDVALLSIDDQPTISYFGKNFPFSIYEYSYEKCAIEWKEKYGKDVYNIISSIFDVDESIIDHISYAPGIADEFIFSKILDIEKYHDIIIMDTAAMSSTFHLLRLQSEFYDHLNRDVKYIISIMDKLKIKDRKILDIIEEWKKLSRDVWKKIRESSIYLVTTDEDIPYQYTKNLEKQISRFEIYIRGTIINRYRGNYNGILQIPEFRENVLENIYEYFLSLNLKKGEMGKNILLL